MAKAIMKKGYDVDAGSFTLALLDGQKIEGNLDKLTPAIIRQAALHGLNQKIGDAAASSGGDQDKAFEQMLAVFERLSSGEWGKPSEKGEGARPTMVIEAVMRVLQKAGKNPVLADVTARYTGEGAEEKRKAALTNPQVKAEYEQLKADAAAKRAADAAKKAAEVGGEAEATVDSL